MNWQDAKRALREPVTAYFEAIRQAERPRRGFARLLQPALQAIDKFRARSRVRDELRSTIGRLHAEAAREANGGALSFSQLPVVRMRIEREMGFLNGFLKDLAGMSEKDALIRIGKYAASAFQTGSAAVTANLPTLPIYPGDWSLACNGFCKCHLKVVTLGNGDFDVYWMLGVAEHCPDCEQLAQTWNPLKVRSGRVI